MVLFELGCKEESPVLESISSVSQYRTEEKSLTLHLGRESDRSIHLAYLSPFKCEASVHEGVVSGALIPGRFLEMSITHCVLLVFSHRNARM